jgi:hypothetical protein
VPRWLRRLAWPATCAATSALLAAVAASLFGAYLLRSDLDHGLHVRAAQRLVAEGVLLPHFAYHLLVAATALWSSDLARLSDAAALVLVLLVLAKLGLSLAFVRDLVSRAGGALRPGPALGLAVVFFLEAPLPKWWSPQNVYLGQLSPTVWHNPTTITALPLAIACFWVFLRGVEAQGESEPGAESRRARLSLDLLAGLLLAAATTAKPNFTLAFAPAAVLVRLRRFDPLGLAALLTPATAVLAWQYLHALLSGFAPEGITLMRPLAVWSLWSPHPAVSTLVSLALPLAVLASSGRRCVLRGPLLAAWLVTLVAVGQFALLAEPEPRLGDGNYYWGVVPAVNLLFLVSAAELLAQAATGRGGRWRRTACWLLLALHAVSGLVLVVRPFQLAVVD